MTVNEFLQNAVFCDYSLHLFCSMVVGRENLLSLHVPRRRDFIVYTLYIIVLISIMPYQLLFDVGKFLTDQKLCRFPAIEVENIVVLFEPVSDAADFVKQGGVAHWLHLLERVLPNLQFAKNEIVDADVDEVIILFREKDTSTLLGDFGRLCIAAVFTGGVKSRVLFGYLKEKSTSSINYVNLYELKRSQNSTFIPFFQELQPPQSHSLCAANIVHMKWSNMSKRNNWFNEKLEHIMQFREAVTNICGSKNSLTNNDTDSEDSFRFRSINLTASCTSFHRTSTSSTLTAQLNSKYMKNETYGATVFWNDRLHNCSDDISSNGWHFNRKISKLLKSKAMQRMQPSPIACGVPDRDKTVLIYQRDISRKFINIDILESMLHGALIDAPSPWKDRKVSTWRIETMVHSNFQPACEIIERVQQATVMITPHGFQSILMLFQPLHSLLIEVHPFGYYKPEVYGLIQAGFRQNIHIGRSYLAEESEPEASVTGSLLQWMRRYAGVGQQECMHIWVCRYFSRLQNVAMSPAFIQRSALFISEHFL